MTTVFREPTGKPAWPITLASGVQKAGKTHLAAEASASPLIGRTIWFTMGEDDPDEFSQIPGARFQIAQHDGTYRGLHTAMQDCLALPNDPQHPTLWVLDSASKLWSLLTDMAQETANNRWAKREANKGKELPIDGVTISMDLWTTAKNRWNGIIDLMREHQGPSIITARLDNVNVVNAKGDPTGEKIWKVQAEKNLPYDVGVVVELRAVGEAYLTGVRSLRWTGDRNAKTAYPQFTMHKLWTDLGLADDTIEAGPRVHVGSTGAQSQAADDLLIAARNDLMHSLREAATVARITTGQLKAQWFKQYGHDINVTTNLPGLKKMLDEVRSFANRDNQPQGNVA